MPFPGSDTLPGFDTLPGSGEGSGFGTFPGVYPSAGTFPGFGTFSSVSPEISAVAGRTPSRLAVSVTHSDGYVTRWGFDEDDPQDIPVGISFSTSIPGGFKTASLTLPRRIDREYHDLNLFDNVKIYAPGGQTVWEGRVAQLPLQHDSSYSVNVGAIGWSAHLTDDPSFSMIYVDRDLSGWGDTSTQRRKDIIDATRTLGSFSVTGDTATGYPALITSMTGPWSQPGHAEAWYDAGPGNLLSAIYYDFTINANISAADTHWSWAIYSASSDTLGGGLGSANLRAASGAAYFTPAAAQRYMMVYQLYDIALGAGFDNVPFDVIWRRLAVYGHHGLTRRGTDPGGFYAADVIRDIIDRAAPLLTYTDESIEQTSFIIPHLAFRDPTTAESAISLVNGYHLYEWGAWEDRVFFWRQPSADRLTWQARLSDGAKVSLEGDDAANVYNGVFVTYQDPSGQTHTVGPPGSRAEATDASLVDTSPENLINAHSLPVKWGPMNISQPTTQAAAIQLGAVWLRERSVPQRRGALTLTGEAWHPTKGDRPVHEIRAGDWVTIADRQGDVPRRIIETSYAHDSRTVQLSLDNTIFRLEALLERLGVSVVGEL